MKKITEYNQQPKWIDKLTSEEAHQWYLKIKQDLPKFKNRGDTSELEQAIVDYEKRRSIK